MRAILCGLAVLACATAVRADEAEDVAARWAAGVGGKVTRDDKAPGKPVVAVSFGPVNKKVTDDGLKELKGLRNLKSLSLFFNGHITDAGMKHVKELTTLESLNIGNTAVTDAGLAELKGMKLKSLTASGCIKMTDKSTETVKGFTDLEYLSLPSTITDKGVKNLVGLKKLRTLYLSGSTVGDAAVKDISALTDLEELYLGTGVTDAALDDLKKMKKLKTLNLFGSKVSDTGLKDLQKALPECKITK